MDSNPTMTREQLEYLFKRKHERPGDVFMELLKRDRPVVCASVYNAFGAKRARQVNEERFASNLPSEYNAIYLGGYAVSGMLWGLPDNGFHDLSMMTRGTSSRQYPPKYHLHEDGLFAFEKVRSTQ